MSVFPDKLYFRIQEPIARSHINKILCYMPYRRLPNTDKARLKALKTALSKGKELPPFKLAFSQKSNQRLQCFLDSYQNAIHVYKQTYMEQTKKNKQYSATMKKARIYLSHFIQVVNMAILRGDLSPDTRKHYGLTADDNRTPPLNSEVELIQWGEKLIRGEAERIMNGCSPITNPTIALVRVRYENFLDAHHHQKTLKKNTARTLEKISDMRSEADDIILQIWNEVEESFKDLPDDLRREKAKEYGLVYIYRKNEINSLNLYN